MFHHVRNFKKRDCFEKLQRYLHDERNWTRVCVVYGFRRTDKTTMLFQAIADLGEKTAYIKMRKTDMMSNLIHDLDVLYHNGYKFI